MRSISRKPKTVLEQNAAEGEARTVFCGSRAARTGGTAVTVCYVPYPLHYIFYSFFILLTMTLDKYMKVSFNKFGRENA